MAAGTGDLRFIKLKKLRFPANDSGTEFNENLVEKLP
jgi:hypothetical protein